MILFHASPCSDLNRNGLKPNRKPTCGMRKDPCVYLGSLEYLEDQYFQYCPKGVYYIFKVDVPEDQLEHLEKVKHYRYWGTIQSDRISPFDVKFVR